MALPASSPPASGFGFDAMPEWLDRPEHFQSLGRRRGFAYLIDAVVIGCLAAISTVIAGFFTIISFGLLGPLMFFLYSLIPAAYHGHPETVRILLGTAIDKDHVNKLGWTALLEAIILGDGSPVHTGIVRMLIEAGANVNLADRDGVTPLQHAKRRGFKEMVRILEERGRGSPRFLHVPVNAGTQGQLAGLRFNSGYPLARILAEFRWHTLS